MHYAVCDYLMDVVQNSIHAGARRIVVRIAERNAAAEGESPRAELLMSVEDDGKGMDERTVGRALDPFFTEAGKHPGRNVGLGLAFLAQVIEMTGGDFSLESAPGRGTSISCRFDMEHLDAPPLGDLTGALTSLLSFPGDFELELYRSRGDLHYGVRRSELIEALGDLDSPRSLALLNQYLESQEEFHGETDP